MTCTGGIKARMTDGGRRDVEVAPEEPKILITCFVRGRTCTMTDMWAHFGVGVFAKSNIQMRDKSDFLCVH